MARPAQTELPGVHGAWPSHVPLPPEENARRARVLVEALRNGRPILPFEPYRGPR